MNKKAIAVAVAGAIGAPGLAMAQTSNVQMYGLVENQWMNNKYSASAASAAGAVATAGVTKNVLHNAGPSRLGVRGTEDLGNNMKAWFQFETTVMSDGRVDNGIGTYSAFTWGGRPSGVGLEGSWGRLTAGIWDSPYKQSYLSSFTGGFYHYGMIIGNTDTTGGAPSIQCGALVSAATGALNAVGAQSATAAACASELEGGSTAFHRRLNDTIQYYTPVWGGFQYKVAYQFGETKASTTAAMAGTNQANHNPSLWSHSLAWSGGPFSAVGAYEVHRGFNATTSGANVQVKDTGLTLGGKWSFGPGAIGLTWERLSYGDNSAPATSAAFAGTTNFKLTNWGINGSWKVTPAGLAWLGYSKTSGRTSCGTANNAGGGFENLCGSASAANIWSIGYDHAMSKRTTLYANYIRINNGQGINPTTGAAIGTTYYYIAGPAVGGGGAAGALAVGTDVTTLGVGIRHTF